MQDVRHQAPAKLQAFEHTTATEIPAQHQRVDTLQEFGVPRHSHARLHMRYFRLAFTEVVVVLQPELACQVYRLDGRRVHEVTLLVLR